MLQARKYLGSVGVGVTRPRLIQGDDGNTYVVKLKNNRLGTRVLANEYIAARFAELVELCFPPGEPMEFSLEFIRRSSRLRNSQVKPGLHFASRYIEKARYVHRADLPFVKNKRQIAGVMLFDHLLGNEDRTLNGKNMLIQKERDGYLFYAIDNSHLFGSGRWRTQRLALQVDRITINKRRAYGSLLRHYLQPEDFTAYSDQFAAITAEQIAALVGDIPEEWLDDAADRQAVEEFLVKRCAAATQIAAKITAMIPAKKG